MGCTQHMQIHSHTTCKRQKLKLIELKFSSKYLGIWSKVTNLSSTLNDPCTTHKTNNFKAQKQTYKGKIIISKVGINHLNIDVYGGGQKFINPFHLFIGSPHLQG